MPNLTVRICVNHIGPHSSGILNGISSSVAKNCWRIVCPGGCDANCDTIKNEIILREGINWNWETNFGWRKFIARE